MSHDKDYDILPVPELEKLFTTSAENGLTAAKASEYLARDGPNELEKAKAPGTEFRKSIIASDIPA